MPRFISWMVIGVAAAFLVFATASFSLLATEWLAVGIAAGTLVVSANIGFRYRADVATLATGVTTALICSWTIVASLVFAQSTVQHLAFASGLAVAGLAIIGLTEHELAHGRAAEVSASAAEHGPRLEAAA